MKNKIFGAQRKRALDLAAKCDGAFSPYLFVLAAYIDEVTRVDDQRSHVELFAHGAHLLSLLGSNARSMPHARTGREYLEGVRADLSGSLNGLPRSAGGAQVDSDPWLHALSLQPGSDSKPDDTQRNERGKLVLQ